MLTTFFHIIRWPNLLMVAAIQVMVFLRLLDTSRSVLQAIDLLLLILVTMIMAAGGYVINDYYDTQTDRINRPARWIAGNTWTLRRVRRCYGLLIFLGALPACVVACRLDLVKFLPLYPLGTAGLWLYSYALKCKPVTGNIWVALFCAGVVGIVALPDFAAGRELVIRPAFHLYILFAFLSTWYREIIKDLEDAAGDARAGCRTFVVSYGIKHGKILAVVTGLLLSASIVWWHIAQEKTWVKAALIPLFLAVILTMLWLYKAATPKRFHRVSAIIKAVMVWGTMILILV